MNDFVEPSHNQVPSPNVSSNIQAEFQSYQEFIREHQQQQLNAPPSLSIRLEPPSPSYKASAYHPIPAASTVVSAASTVNSGPNSHSSPQHQHTSPQQAQGHQYQAPTVLPKINFKISDALLKDPEPFAAKIGELITFEHFYSNDCVSEKSARNSFVVDSHELSPRVINRKTNQPKGTARYMEIVHSNSADSAAGGQPRYHNNDDISEVSMENDEVSVASSSVDTTANNSMMTANGQTKRYVAAVYVG